MVKDDIHVTHGPGGRQHLQISASTVLPLAPLLAFRIITHPENEKIFRHLERCEHHQVLEQDKASGRVVVESEHVATWRLFALSGRLRTRLRSEQDHCSLVSRFELIPGRFNLLRVFGGKWTVEPQPPGSAGDECCLLTLGQELQPAIFLPPPLGSILRQLACRQLRSIFQDLRAEAARINSGSPTLWGNDTQQQRAQQAQAQHKQQQVETLAAPHEEELGLHVPQPDGS